jgi:pimeloyl-ACP methyl ester carboxylesterase
MPEKYVRREGVPILLRHTGPTTLPQDPPRLGSDSAIVCLHDAGLQSSVFIDLLGTAGLFGSGGSGGSAEKDIEQGAIAFDLPGHGRSGSLDSLPSIAAMSEVAQWVADWCGATRPILVGHGMGALIALEWARDRSDSVAGLVLCGAGLALGIQDETIELMRQVTRGKAPRPFDPKRVSQEGGQDMMRRAYMEGIQTDPRSTLVDLEASRAWADAFASESDGVAGWGGIACPVAIVSGAQENEACRARAEALRGPLGQASTFEVEGAAHFLPLEKPEDLAAEIQRLMEAA